MLVVQSDPVGLAQDFEQYGGEEQDDTAVCRHVEF